MDSYICKNKYCREVGNHASYLRCPRNLLFWLKFFVGFLIPSRQIPVKYLKLVHSLFLPLHQTVVQEEVMSKLNTGNSCCHWAQNLTTSHLLPDSWPGERLTYSQVETCFTNIHFHPEDGESSFLRNFGKRLIPDYTASHPRRQV
jgi:hypothetical protein